LRDVHDEHGGDIHDVHLETGATGNWPVG